MRPLAQGEIDRMRWFAGVAGLQFARPWAVGGDEWIISSIDEEEEEEGSDGVTGPRPAEADEETFTGYVNQVVDTRTEQSSPGVGVPTDEYTLTSNDPVAIEHLHAQDRIRSASAPTVWKFIVASVDPQGNLITAQLKRV
jgi:hypothetical protein